MKYRIYLLTLVSCCAWISLLNPLAADYTVDTKAFNVNTQDNGKGSSIDKNTGNASEEAKKLLYGDAGKQSLIMDGGSDIKTTNGLKNAGFKIVRSIKNIVIFLASTVLIILVLRLISAGVTEEEVKRLKAGVVGIAIGIFVMQTAATLVGFFLAEQSVNGQVAYDIYQKILAPLAQFLMTFGQIAFLFMATWAALRLTTAAGNDEKIKTAKVMLTSAIIGFLLLQVPKVIVAMFYGDPEKSGDAILLNPDMSGIAAILADILRYVNGFLALAIVLMIIYAGAKMALSGGDEESLKKAKSMVIYIVVGCILLMASFGFLQLILTGVITF